MAPANLESFGLAALEARCAGLPVVAKAQTGIREFVEHGQEGLLAANDHQFVDQVLALVRDPELRAKIAAFNRATPARCEWPEVVQLTLDAYARRPPSSPAGAVSRPDASVTPGLHAVAPQRHEPARVMSWATPKPISMMIRPPTASSR